MNQPLLDHATQTMAVGSKSFATAARLFAPETRRSALMLYAWCRHCDDVIDDQHLGFQTPQRPDAIPAQEGMPSRDPSQGQDSAQAHDRLAELRDATRLAYTDARPEAPAFAAFQEVAVRHAIPAWQAFDHLEGYAMDVRDERYAELDDTLRYCYHVAGVVGLMMARVMGVRDEAVLDRACDLGLAFQLTNIARDIVDDAAIGRCYLPLRWLEEAGIASQAIADPAHRTALAGVARRLVATAEPYYASAREGLPGLPLRSAWAIATARGVYRRIGTKVDAAGADAWNRRQGTSKPEKLALLMAGAATALSSRGRQPRPREATLWQRPTPHDADAAAP